MYAIIIADYKLQVILDFVCHIHVEPIKRNDQFYFSNMTYVKIS